MQHLDLAIAIIRRPKPLPPPEARQILYFPESTFLGWFSEGMEWRSGEHRAVIMRGIPDDALLTGAYFDQDRRRLVILLRSASAEVGELDVEFTVGRVGRDLGPSRN